MWLHLLEAYTLRVFLLIGSSLPPSPYLDPLSLCHGFKPCTPRCVGSAPSPPRPGPLCPAWSAHLDSGRTHTCAYSKWNPSLPFPLFSSFPSMTIHLSFRKEFSIFYASFSMSLSPTPSAGPSASPRGDVTPPSTSVLPPVSPTPPQEASEQPSLLAGPVLRSRPPAASSQTLKAHWVLSFPCRGYSMTAQASPGPA